jgi:outer membrane protein OmpA-like peptidoglycan-associated protein
MKFGSFNTRHAIMALAMVVFATVGAHAQDSRWALPLSASVGIGSMKDSDMNLKSRTMSALSLEALPSYRLGKWLLGPHLDYRWQGQMTNLNSAGGTNLKGHGYLMGLGARHDFTHRFFTQASVDFFGQYDFSKQTSAHEDDKLKTPLGVRVKSGYAFIEKIPNLTFDIDLQYLTFKKIHISQTESNATTNQWMASVGVTYQFGKNTLEESSGPMAEAPPDPHPTDAPEDLKDTRSVIESLGLNLSDIHFDSQLSDLKSGAKDQLGKVAEALKKNPTVDTHIEGHADSSGNEKINDKLSRRRANSVKTFLVAHGVEKSRISIEGFGSAKPVADNNTKKGRAQNRRVEIYFSVRAGLN